MAFSDSSSVLDNFQSASTVRAEIITELILKRAGPVIFKSFYWN